METPQRIDASVVANAGCEVGRAAGCRDDHHSAVHFSGRGSHCLEELARSRRLLPLREFVDGEEVGAEAVGAGGVGGKDRQRDSSVRNSRAVGRQLNRAGEVWRPPDKPGDRVEKQRTLIPVCCNGVKLSADRRLGDHDAQRDRRYIR